MLVLWLNYQAIPLKQLKSSTSLLNIYLDEETHCQGISEHPFVQAVSIKESYGYNLQLTNSSKC